MKSTTFEQTTKKPLCHFKWIGKVPHPSMVKTALCANTEKLCGFAYGKSALYLDLQIGLNYLSQHLAITKFCIGEILNLLTCADSSINTKQI